MRKPITKVKGIYFDDETGDLVIECRELCEYFNIEPTPFNEELVKRFAEKAVNSVLPGIPTVEEIQFDSKEVN